MAFVRLILVSVAAMIGLPILAGIFGGDPSAAGAIGAGIFIVGGGLLLLRTVGRVLPEHQPDPGANYARNQRAAAEKAAAEARFNAQFNKRG